jgi:hypothetical protein
MAVGDQLSRHFGSTTLTSFDSTPTLQKPLYVVDYNVSNFSTVLLALTGHDQQSNIYPRHVFTYLNTRKDFI